MFTNYRKEPSIKIRQKTDIFSGFEAIKNHLYKELKKVNVISIETYPGTYKDTLIEGLKDLFDVVIDTDTVNYAGKKLDSLLYEDLTDDRVFGYFTHKTLESITDKVLFEQLKEQVRSSTEKMLLIGFGSSRFADDQVIIFTSVTRWEIQLRYRSQLVDNYNANNHGEDVLRMFKRGYFVDWRIADNYKDTLWNSINYYMDCDDIQHPKMMSKSHYQNALNEVVTQPFMLVPYFDPGLWGGQWMKEKFNLSKDKPNFAWSFNGLPEENAILLDFNGEKFRSQAMDLVLFTPYQLLGEKNLARLGREFPIRFDFLDTMDGGNLSLQVHPKVDYAMRNFGLHYTQDESYYILDAKEEAYVYLGVKDGVSLDDLISDLQKANQGESVFDDEKYINKIEAKKHDHFLIPSGTIHCSGKDTMVLEISHTPYIFTFKIWDWGRVGMDGLPRPVHLHHAKHVIDMDRRTDWVMNNLVNDVRLISESEGVKQERTGLHELEMIETHRTWFTQPFDIKMRGTFHMFMLVEGDSVTITSKTGDFEPFVAHYAECFIVPAAVGEIHLTPHREQKCAIIDAYIRESVRED